MSLTEPDFPQYPVLKYTSGCLEEHVDAINASGVLMEEQGDL